MQPSVALMLIVCVALALAAVAAAVLYGAAPAASPGGAPPTQVVVIDATKQPAASGIPAPPARMFDAPPALEELGFIPVPPGDAVPINVPTRGVPQQYQQVGVLAAPGGSDTSASPSRTLLPLFGRIVNRTRWNYYTRTDGLNPVQVPVQFKRRDCSEDIGCEEISDGDTVAVPLLGQSYVASTYRLSTPRYLPGVI